MIISTIDNRAGNKHETKLVIRSSLTNLEEYIIEIKSMWYSHWHTNMGPQHKQFQTMHCYYMSVENIEFITNGHMALESTLQALNLEERGNNVVA